MHTENTAAAAATVRTSAQARLRRLLGRVNWSGLGVILLVLIAWELLVDFDVLDYLSLPGPYEIVSRGFLGQERYGDGPNDYLESIIASGELKTAFLHTLGVVLRAWGIGVVVGILLGLAIGLSTLVSRFTLASVDVLRSLPVIAFVPIVFLLWGATSKAEIAVGAWACTWPMVINTSGAVSSISPLLKDVSRTFRLSRVATLRKIVLPAIGPSVLVGARIAMAIALILVIVCELIAIPLGLGYAMRQNSDATNYARMWAIIFTIGTLGFVLNALLVYASRKLFPGVSQAETRSR